MSTYGPRQIHTPTEAREHYEDAQSFERSDDRYLIANQFFQIVGEARGMSRRDSASVASDWSSFGYREHSLEEYLVAYFARREAARRGR